MALIPLYAGGRLTKGEQRFFLNSVEVPGIQSFQAQFDIGAAFFKYVGVKNIDQIPRSAQIGGFSIASLLISDDMFINFTGNTGFNGYLIKDKTDTTQNFSFASGYLTSYTSRGSLGSIPEIEMVGTVFGNAGRLTSSESTDVSAHLGAIPTSNPTGVLKIPGPGSIDISIDDFVSNRVQSYDINIAVNRNPYYTLGQRPPYSVELNYPLEVTATFVIDVFDYNDRKMFDFPLSPNIKNLGLTVKDYLTSLPMASYNFNNMFLTTDRYNASVSANSTVQLTYKTYLTR